MSFGIEIFSVIAAGIVISLSSAFFYGLCDPLREAGQYFMPERFTGRHYKLNRSRALFSPVFATNKKRKSGYISRRAFWQTMAGYIFYLLLIVAEVVVYLITSKGIFSHSASAFMALILIPAFASIPLCLISLLSKEDIDADEEELNKQLAAKKKEKVSDEIDEEAIKKELEAKIKKYKGK